MRRPYIVVRVEMLEELEQNQPTDAQHVIQIPGGRDYMDVSEQVQFETWGCAVTVDFEVVDPAKLPDIKDATSG